MERETLRSARPRNHTVFSVMADEQVDRVMALVREVCGDLNGPSTGIVFAVPVTRVEGLSRELGQP